MLSNIVNCVCIWHERKRVQRRREEKGDREKEQENKKGEGKKKTLDANAARHRKKRES